MFSPNYQILITLDPDHHYFSSQLSSGRLSPASGGRVKSGDTKIYGTCVLGLTRDVKSGRPLLGRLEAELEGLAVIACTYPDCLRTRVQRR